MLDRKKKKNFVSFLLFLYSLPPNPIFLSEKIMTARNAVDRVSVSLVIVVKIFFRAQLL